MTNQIPVLTNENRQKLIEDNINLVHFIVHKYFPNIGFEYEELVSIGCIGLIKASRTYDPTKVKFSSYAFSCIRNEILMLIRKSKKDIDAIPISSGDDDEGYNFLENKLVSEDDIENELITRSYIDSIMSLTCLTSLEQQVMNMIYVDDMNQREVGTKLCKSRSYISRVHNNAINKLRRVLNENN